MSKENFSTGSSHNTIAQGTSVEGNIKAETDLRIDGVIMGNVECNGKIIIGPKGSVTGDIQCENAEILGILSGNAKIRGLLILAESAQILGDVEMAILSVEPNAVLTGYCTMIRE